MSDLLTGLGLAGSMMLPALLGLALKATVVLSLTAAVVYALRRRSASVRHLVWSVGTVAVLALPVLTYAAPAWDTPGTAALRPLAPGGFDISATEAPASPPTPEPTVTAAWSGVAAAPAPTVVPDAAPAVAWGEREAAPLGESESATFRIDVPPTVWLLVVWAMGTILALSIVADGLVRSARLARAARPIRDAQRRDLFLDLCAEVGYERHVRLLEVDGASMPMTWGALSPVILLPAESSCWSNARLHAVLSHELAHIRRHDYMTQLLAQVSCAIHWFNPLAWIAARQLREERELACDDMVLTRGERASDYARHLLDVARELRASPLPAAATVCMVRRSSLHERLLAVLDATRVRADVRREFAVPAALGALLVALPLAGAGMEDARDETPVVPTAEASLPRRATSEWADGEVAASSVAPAPDRRGVLEIVSGLFAKAAAPPAPATQGCDWYTRGRNTSSSHVADDNRHEIRIRHGDCRMEIEYKGDIEFAADDTDIVRISRGGSFEIELREGRNTRLLQIEPRDGGLQRTWTVNGEERAYDANASAWFARMLVVVFRRTGVNAEQRATRILAESGVDGLLQEISFITSDWAAVRYYTVLLSQPNLDVETIRRVVREAGQRVESDFELARLLIAIAENQPVDEAVQVAYVAAAGSIDSDYEHRRVLSAILRRQDLSEPVANAMLQSAQDIDSDFERARLLLEVLEAHPLNEALTPAFFDAVRTIGSDFEQRRVLSTVLDRGAPNVAVLDQTLTVARNIQSDHELARLLVQVADQYPVDVSLPASYLDAARSLGSDHERSRVLRTLLGRETLSPRVTASVLAAAGSMTSNFELSRILKGVAMGDPLTAPTRDAFFRALDGMESDHELSTVLQTVIEHQPLDDDLVGRVLQSALQIGSDHSLAQLLIKIANDYTLGDAVRPAFMLAVDRIESEHTRGQVLAALYPRGRPAE